MSVPSHHLLPVLRRICSTYRVHNRETAPTYMLKVLRKTMCVVQCMLDICNDTQTMETTSRWGTMSRASLARIRMRYMMDDMREIWMFPLRLLENNNCFGIPRFMVLGLVASGYSVHEIREMIARLVRELYLSGHPCSPLWISPRLLRRAQLATTVA